MKNIQQVKIESFSMCFFFAYCMRRSLFNMFNKAEITLLPRAASRAKNAAKPRLRRPVPIARRSSVLFFGSGFG